MNRSSIPWLSAFSFICATGFMIACGPRMKPVEYEDPGKGKSSASDYDDTSSASSDDSASSSASSSAKASNDSSDKGTASDSAGPCKGKKCGETCSECSPSDENCNEILVLKQCDLKGACVPAKVECSAASDKDAKGKDAKGKDAKGKDAKDKSK